MGKIIDFNKRISEPNLNDIDEKEIDVPFLTYRITNGSTSYECVDMILAHFKQDEVALENGMRLYRNKIGNLDVQFEEDGEKDAIGLSLFLTLAKANR